MKHLKLLAVAAFLLVKTISAQKPAEKSMDKMWDGASLKQTKNYTERGKVFREGRYAMFVHWGLYSQLANIWEGKTYYGIGEWLMHKRMANIGIADYIKVAQTFNPKKFNADSIVQLAKDAGMKYIIITSKHHEGFAMFHSKDDPFNVVDATPFKRDPMKELALACKKAGLGFGFYYSQNQDWTAPGGNNGPQKDSNGKPVSFDEYFNAKCLPQVKQITTDYGPIVLVWFDTPGGMDKKYAQKLVEVVHQNQPGAYVSGRVGHGLGDYSTLGDMEVPKQNVEGLWESVDVTNDSWGYAWYDQNWKTPKEILTRTLSTICRGGNYMLNVGPMPNGEIPGEAAASLRSAGSWVKRYPGIVYKSQASPWKHALPWGDACINKNTVSLLVYDWPATGKLYLPGLQSSIISAKLLYGNEKKNLTYKKEAGWIVINIPLQAPEKMVSVIELQTTGIPKADETLGIDPQQPTILETNFAETKNAEKKSISWMVKFGEWKHQMQVSNWQKDGAASWNVEVLKPGFYQVSLYYTGTRKLVWKVSTSGQQFVQNQQNASSIYSWHPVGWIKIEKPGKHRIDVSLVEGDSAKASLGAVKLEPLTF